MIWILAYLLIGALFVICMLAFETGEIAAVAGALIGVVAWPLFLVVLVPMLVYDELRWRWQRRKAMQ
jgi:hypothetical protein